MLLVIRIYLLQIILYQDFMHKKVVKIFVKLNFAFIAIYLCHKTKDKINYIEKNLDDIPSIEKCKKFNT